MSADWTEGLVIRLGADQPTVWTQVLLNNQQQAPSLRRRIERPPHTYFQSGTWQSQCSSLGSVREGKTNAGL